MPASEIRATCRNLWEEHGLDLVIVDYLQLIGAEDNPDGFAEIWDAARDLKGLAREMNVPVIAVCPINRSSERREDKRPWLTDLPPIEQYADVVVLTYRGAQYEKVTEEEEALEQKGGEEMDVIVAKQNSGPVGTVRLVFHPKTARIEDMDWGEDTGF